MCITVMSKEIPTKNNSENREGRKYKGKQKGMLYKVAMHGLNTQAHNAMYTRGNNSEVHVVLLG